MQVADINGDGIDDLIGQSTLAGYAGNWYAAISTADGTGTSRLLTKWNPAHNWADIQTGDFNGDGRDDIIGRSTLAGYDGNWYGIYDSLTGLPKNNAGVSPRAQLIFGATGAPTNVFDQVSSQLLSLDYDVTAGGSYSGMTINYVQDGGSSGNFSNLNNNELVVQLKGANGSQVKFEIQDADGTKESVVLDSVSSNFQSYIISLDIFSADLDLTQITFISFVVDGNLVPATTGTLEVKTPGLLFTEETISSDPLLTAGDVSTLPLTPFTALLGGAQGDSSYVQLGTGAVEVLYDTSSAGSFAGSTISFDDFGTPGVETADLSGMSELIFGASGPNGASVKIEFQDATGSVESRVLEGLSSTDQYYKILQNGFAIVDWSQIRFIKIIVEDAGVPNDLGVIKVEVNGLKDDKALTAEQEALRQTILSETLAFFEDGMGVNQYLQFPYDQITYDSDFHNPFAIKNTQPTSIGFYAQILGDAIRERTVIPSVAKADALNRLETMMNRLLEVQADGNLSWNGLLPFFDLDSVVDNVNQITPLTSTIGLGDNANMAQSIAVMIGALEGGSFAGAEATQVADIITDATQVLSNMFAGFDAFFDSTTVYNGEQGYFRHAVDMGTGTFSGYVDRMTNEFRAPVAFLVSYYGDGALFPTTNITQDAWDNLNVNLVATQRDYTDSDGDTIANNVPYHGGAFQMFWPLLRTNEQDYVELTATMQNFLYSAADFAEQNNIPGFPSTGLVPQPKVLSPATWEWLYEGDAGIPALSEAQNNGEALVYNMGNLYSLVSAFALNPDFVMSWTSAIRDAYPMFVSDDYGFYDSIISGQEIGESHYSIDQASIILALSNYGGDDFDAFMQTRNLDDDFRNLYRSIDMQLGLTDKALPTPPTFPSGTLTVFDHLVGEGRVELGGNPFPHDFLTSSTGMRFNYSSQTTDGGHYWLLNDSFDVKESVLRFDYSVTTTPQDIKIVLRNAADDILGEFDIQNLDTTPGIHTAEVNITNLAAFADQEVKVVHLIVEPTQTGVQAADFYVYQIQFRHFPLTEELSPDAGLGASDVTTLPGTPETDPMTGGGGTSSINQVGTTGIEWTYDVSAGGSFSGAMVHYDDFGTAGVTETEDLSGLDSFVIGVDGPATTKVKVEVEDANGTKSSVILTGVGTTQAFWEVRLDYFSSSIDWTNITMINFVVDGTLVTSTSGQINIETAGLST